MNESDTTHDGTGRRESGQPGKVDMDRGTHHHYYQHGYDAQGRPVWDRTSSSVPGQGYDPSIHGYPRAQQVEYPRYQSAFPPDYHAGGYSRTSTGRFQGDMNPGRSRQHYDGDDMHMTGRGVYLDPQMIHDIAMAVAHKMAQSGRFEPQHSMDQGPSNHRMEIVFVPNRGGY